MTKRKKKVYGDTGNEWYAYFPYQRKLVAGPGITEERKKELEDVFNREADERQKQDDMKKFEGVD